MARKEVRAELSDLGVLAALAHPARHRILGYLLAIGPRTATECADIAEITPSACSYHLRRLQEFGLVERVTDDVLHADGRERPWRATATGVSIASRPSQTAPATLAASKTLIAADLDESRRLALAYLEVEDGFPDDWRDSATFHTYGLMVTPEEMNAVTQAIDELLRPFLAPTRENLPGDADHAHVTVQAFRRPR